MVLEFWISYWHMLMTMFTIPIKTDDATYLRRNQEIQTRRIDNLEKRFYSAGL